MDVRYCKKMRHPTIFEFKRNLKSDQEQIKRNSDWKKGKSYIRCETNFIQRNKMHVINE